VENLTLFISPIWPIGLVRLEFQFDNLKTPTK